MPSFVSGVAKLAAPVDRVKNRLEQLDEEEDDGVVLKLTQKEYTAHIEKRRAELIEAWDGDKRVKALKTAIKCAKLLGDTAQVVAFYPSKWVLITEILDAFGLLVFERLKARSAVTLDDGTSVPLKDNFRAEDVADHAQETCRNWFFKIASIRELLPRLYMEMALLASYRFIENDVWPQVLLRLMRMVRGIGDPLVAAYTRAYLARKGLEVLRGKGVVAPPYLAEGLKDWLATERLLPAQPNLPLPLPRYLELYAPALDWLLECLAWRGDQRLLDSLLAQAQPASALVLQALLGAFPPRLVAANALRLVQAVQGCEGADRLSLYRTLGVHVALAAPRPEEKVALLNAVWGEVAGAQDVGAYLRVAEVWIAYPLAHLTLREVDILLRDLLAHVTPEQRYLEPQHQAVLASVVHKLLGEARVPFRALLGLKHLLPLLDLFRGDTQTEVNKLLLHAFVRAQEPVRDEATREALFSVARTVHDSMHALSFSDERREIGALLAAFMRLLDFGRDFERHLAFLADARRALADLDAVRAELVRQACALVVRTVKRVGGAPSKETAAFVRACLAFVYITLPALEDALERLALTVHAAEVALLGQSVSQAEALLKAAIQLVAEVPRQVLQRDGRAQSTAPELLGQVQLLCALLVAVPGHPERGALYLLEPLLTVLKDYEWEPRSTLRAQALLPLLRLGAALSVRTPPYAYARIESNLELFGYTLAYRAQLERFNKDLAAALDAELERLQQYQDAITQAQIAAFVLDLGLALAPLTAPPARPALRSALLARLQALRARPEDLRLLERSYA